MRQFPQPHKTCARPQRPKQQKKPRHPCHATRAHHPVAQRWPVAPPLAAHNGSPQPHTHSRTGTPNGPRLVLALNQHWRLGRAEQLRRRQRRARESAKHLVARVVPPAVEVLPAVGVVPPVTQATGGRRRHPRRRAAILPARRRGGCCPAAGGASGCRCRRGGGPPRPPAGGRGGGGDRPASGAEGGPSAADKRGGGRGWHRGRGKKRERIVLYQWELGPERRRRRGASCAARTTRRSQ